MNKLEIDRQEYESSLNIKFCLVMSSNSTHVEIKKLNEQV